MSSTPASPPVNTNPAARSVPTRGSRRWRWAVRVVVGVPMVGVVVALLLIRSPMIGRLVGTTVSELSGGEWRARRAVIGLNGQLIVNDLTLRAPGVKGPGGEVLTAESAVADIDWSGLPVLRWFRSSPPGAPTGPRITAIRLTKPTFRLSQSIDDDSLNIASLKPSPQTGAGRVEPPRIDVIDGKVEFAEHSPRRGGYTLLNTLPVSGSFSPAAPGLSEPVYSLRLQETGRSPAAAVERRGMILDGRIDLATDKASLRLFNVSLDAWPPESVPMFMRDIWRRLNMKGRVSEATFTYSPDTGIDSVITVEKISMEALVPAPGVGDSGAYLSLREVNGEIALSTSGLHADLMCVIEDQTFPSRVRLDTYGTDLNCSLRCEITADRINVSRNPAFLKYTPKPVRQYLDWFSGPTADVIARVVITRGDPVDGKAASFEVPEGKIDFSGGVAAFHKFPYRFHDMSGEVSFDDQNIRFIRIRGAGPTGAKLSASGLITPLTDDAKVDLTIGVQGVPVDDHMLDAMRPGYRSLLDALFCREHYQTLVAKGLIVPRKPEVPEDGGDTDGPPEFEFGGRADIGIKINRPLGPLDDWTTNIEVEFERAGIVPEPFPFPIVARDVRLLITDNDAVFTRGEFAGLSGGYAELEARVQFGEHDTDPMIPEVRIVAFDIPVDGLLLNAVPGDEGEGGTLSADRVLQNLKIEGLVDCRVAITAPRAGAMARARADVVGPIALPVLDWSVVVELDKLAARPITGLLREREDVPSVAMCLRELSGALEVTPRSVHVASLQAEVGRLPVDQLERPLTEAAPCGRMEIDLTIDLEDMGRDGAEAGATGPQVLADIALRGVDLADPVEQAVAVFKPVEAETLAELRGKRQPTGLVDAHIRLEQSSNESSMVSVHVDHSEHVGAHALGGVVWLDDLRGGIGLVSSPSRSNDTGAPSDVLRFENLSARLRLNEDVAGEVRVDGHAAISSGGSGLAAPADLLCTMRDWRFEAPLVHELITKFAGTEMSSDYDRVKPRGSFDASLIVGGDSPETVQGRGAQTGVRIAGVVEPRSFGFTRRDRAIDLSRTSGRITFDVNTGVAGGVDPTSARGELQNIEVGAEEWSAAANGRWMFDEATGFTLETALTMAAPALSDSLVELLPKEAREGVRSSGLKVDGPIDLSDATLVVRDPPLTELDATFSGTIAFSGASADIGVVMDRAEGEAKVRVGGSDQADSRARVDLALTRVRLASVQLADAFAQVRWLTSGDLDESFASARCHGGRVSAEFSTETSEVAAGQEPRKSVRIKALMSGVKFAPLLADIESSGFKSGTSAGSKGAGGSAPPDPRPSPLSDDSRGTIDARLTLTSVIGDTASRRGHGAIRIANGDVLRLPIVLPLVKVSNLMLPFGDRLNYLQSSFYVDGPTAVFDEISLLSESLAIVGNGTVTWPELEVDMRFNSRSITRIPFWSDIFEAVRNEIISTTITGTVADPVVRSEPLMTTRRVIGDVIGGGGGEDAGAGSKQTRAARLSDGSDRESAARRELERLRNASTVFVPSEPR